MTGHRTCEQVLRDALRDGLPPRILEGFGRDAMARVEAAMKERAGAPDGPGTPAPATDCKGVDQPMTKIKHPMELEVGDIIAVDPDTGQPCEKRVAAPPVRFHDDVEVDYTEAGCSGRLVVPQRAKLTVDFTHRERRHHGMSHGEEHYAMVWLREHEPQAFDRAADYVDQIRAFDGGDVRVETRNVNRGVK